MTDELKTPPKTVELRPLKSAVDFAVTIPGSKSIANRALLAAGMAAGSSLLAGIPGGDDTLSALSALGQLGVGHENPDEGTYRIHGCGHAPARTADDIDIRSAGTVGRFLPGLLASASEGEWRLVSTEQLARRPLAPLIDALKTWGADILCERDGLSFPLRVKGGGLTGGEVEISAAASTQFASGLLMAAPFAKHGGAVRITDLSGEDRYIDTTLDVMRHFGAEAASAASAASGAGLTVFVKPGAYRANDFRVEADLNAALNFLALPLLAGGRAAVTNVSGDTRQTGHQLLSVFARMGAGVDAGPQGVSVSCAFRLKGGFVIDMRALAEMALTLGVLALFADAPVTMTNLGHIRHHETDRLAAIGELLAQVGAETETGPDWVRVHPLPRERIRNAAIDSRGDHRVVMAFSLLGLAANGITITNADAVSKTFPAFFRRLRGIGAEVSGSRG